MANTSSDLSISVMITSRNRLPELRRTLDVLESLDPVPLEILVTADGCTDGTVEFLEQWSGRYGVGRSDVVPSQLKPGRGTSWLRVIVNETGIGSVGSRARMMREAIGDLVLALDDDSYPEQKDCLALLARLFAERSQLAIAYFPQRTDEYPETLNQADFGLERPVRSFACSGACLRASTYRSLPGFEPMFFHMYEEPDYALQCVANGWEVSFIPGLSIRHLWTPNQRSEVRNHHRHARNEFWSTTMRCPMPYTIAFAGYRILSQAFYAAKRGPSWLIREPLWWLQAIRGLPQALRRREPVTWKGYCKWLSLPGG